MTLNFRNKKDKFFQRLQLPEVLLDSLTQKEEGDFFEKRLEVPLSKNPLFLFFLFIIGGIILLFLRSFQLQVIEHKNLLALAEKNRFVIKRIEAQRGVIYDQNFTQLVFNKPSFTLILNKSFLPKDISKREKVLKETASILGKDLNFLKEKIEKTKEERIEIVRDLDYKTLLILETKISQLPGFQIKNNTIREYPDGEIFSKVIGYKTRGGVTAGLESEYNELLTEKPGEIMIKKDARGRIVSQEVVENPSSGKSLLLWLDAKIQKKVYQELKKVVERENIKIATAVVLDAQTGGVLALVSFPTYDNNLFSKGLTKKEWEKIQKNPFRPLFNYPISGEFPPASTIKPLLALAALEEKIISPTKKIYCPGYIEIPNPWDPSSFTRLHDWRKHGFVDMRKAIAHSCNVYFFTIGGGYGDQKGLGVRKIKKYLSLFGWGKATNIDLSGENEGFLPDPEWKKKEKGERWTLGDTYLLSIGQGFVRVTPLQLAVSYLPIANGGKLLKPQLVKAILDSKKRIIKEIPHQIERDLVKEGKIKKENLKVVREGMRRAVLEGSCKRLNELPVKTACKTGTSEVGEKDIHHGWVVVFAPYEKPEIILVIFLYKVKKYSHRLVLTCAKDILEWYFKEK